MGSLADDLEVGQCYAFQIVPKKLGKTADDLDKTLCHRNVRSHRTI